MNDKIKKHQQCLKDEIARMNTLIEHYTRDNDPGMIPVAVAIRDTCKDNLKAFNEMFNPQTPDSEPGGANKEK
jgi:hypothetical protein